MARIKGCVCGNPPAPADPVAVEILEPRLDILLATALDQPFVHVELAVKVSMTAALSMKASTLKEGWVEM